MKGLGIATTIVLVTSIMATASLGPAAAQDASAAPEQISWVTAGDSYSSGQSLPSLAGSRDEDCARSDSAYGPRTVRRLSDDAKWKEWATRWKIQETYFTACTGAVTEHFYNIQVAGENGFFPRDEHEPQWEQIASEGTRDARVDIIVMSLGGNDVGFEGAIDDCVFFPDDLNEFGTIVEIVSWSQILGLGAILIDAAGCGRFFIDKDDFEDEYGDRIDYLVHPPNTCSGPRYLKAGDDRYSCDLDLGSNRGSIVDLYVKIVEDHLTDRGQLYVVGYPQFFASPSDWQGIHGEHKFGLIDLGWNKIQACWSAWIWAADARILNRLAQRLNSTLSRAVDEANNQLLKRQGSGDIVHYLDVRDLYGDDEAELCGEGEDWLNGVVVRDGGLPTPALQSSFHPNSRGHANTAAALAELVVEKWPRSPEPTFTYAPDGEYVAVDASWDHACALSESGDIECWGNNQDGQTDVPAGRYEEVSAGDWHSCGILKDGGLFASGAGSVRCWGNNFSGQLDAPDGLYGSIASGWDHSCAVQADSSIVCWGNDQFGQARAPNGSYKTVTAGNSHSCALRVDRTITCWGTSQHGQTDAPSGTYSVISTGSDHSCAVSTRGSIACWGADWFEQTNAPSGNYTDVAAGYGHSCAVRTDNAITCWGDNSDNQTAAPYEGDYSAISAGRGHTCAIELSTDDAEGSGLSMRRAMDRPKVVCWGSL